MYLLPAPQKCSYNNQKFILQYNTEILLDSKLGFHELIDAEILQKQIEESLGFNLAVGKSYHKENDSIFLTISEEMKPEEYQLLIKQNQIILTGGSSGSLFYAVQTLRQIITQQGAILEGVEIFDYPELQNRGFYYDVTRGRIPTLETLMELADKMSYYKLNQLQLYMEHSFLLKDFSEVWRDDTPLTAEEILKLDEYCSRRNIELVPSIASFGHLHKILTSKTYAELCEIEHSDTEPFSYVRRMQHHTVDVSNGKSIQMIKNMLAQFLPLFSSKKCNICADETFDLGKGRSKELADRIGVNRMYTGFLNQICEYVKMYGKQPMFWGDILLSYPEAFRELPEDSICLNWDYCLQVNETNIKKLHDLGVRQYLCPGVHGWKRLINSLDNSYSNILTMSRYAHKYKAEGFLNTDWGDFGHINHPEFSTAGMIYGAAFSWNSELIEFEDLNRQISAIEYLDPSESFLSIVARMSKQDNALWDHLVQYKESRQNRIGEKNEQEQEYFSHIDLKLLEASNTEVTKAVEEMYRLITRMASHKRSIVKAYLVAAKGIVLFNKLAAAIGVYQYQVEGSLQFEPSALAVMLEYWWKDYKEIWRKQYKESELYRIQEVIFWYADWLRDICK